MDLGAGILTVEVKAGKLVRDTEMIGSMSPYITLVFNGKKLKTKVHSGGGKEPEWGDKFQLEVESPTEEIFLRVWDQDMTTSDAIGFTKVKVSSLMINGGLEDWFTITYDNKPAGEILLSSEFAPEGGDAYENMKAEYEAQEERLIAEKEEAEAQLAELQEKQAALEEEMAAKAEE